MLLEGKRIFIVEDNLQNRVVFQMALMKHGAAVEFERKGPDAIRQLNRMDHIDLIILDLMLAGGVSGYEIYDEIRALPRFAKVPIIAVSASDPASAIPRTQAQGFNGFIPKPIDEGEFARQIERVIHGDQVWAIS